MAAGNRRTGARRGRLTPGRVRNLLGIAKVVGPALAPVVLPFAVRAAGTIRDGYDRFRARQLGVPVADLPEFTGRGARLHARIAGVSRVLAALRAGRLAPSAPDAAALAFADQAQARLETLAVAVRAAERMPSVRRRPAHRAVAAELDQIEDDLLRHLGV
ncbi:DUF6474 family protein [Goodfellowiella coeruleoviolacea]|uniref:Uncharacterized protein n=1 Tax=Goodfellowiella coeruleoviolacea TaxID=334858 RepID=A0AAE3GIX6_9PSEU|nr:DUF6474 family protein [Goodfellowiella coeruleoviolacea]MCP2169052.1 hypothetical protein [Goodfellowiella coeruleoviolacea]